MNKKITISKYEPLWNYIKENNKDNYILSYDEIKSILGFNISHSFLTYKKELISYGYIVKKVSLKEHLVYIDKII